METEIKYWLRKILKDNIEDHSVNILGNPEKDDGYLSDILFVNLTPNSNNEGKTYELVLKCNKTSQAFRETTPIKEAFKSEMFIYNKVIPEFTKFQAGKGIRDYVQIIVLENLKISGYVLWDKKHPFTRKHIDLVVEEYAKFHSLSIALQINDPQKFKELSDCLGDTLNEFVKANNLGVLFGRAVLEIHDLLKGDLDEDTLSTWKILYEKAHFILEDMVDKNEALTVILHASCWCNNFMFKYASGENLLPIRVSMLDWQMSRTSSPILDLSYFIFSHISSEDIQHMSDILNVYYEKLKLHSSQLGADLHDFYPKQQFLDDWRKYVKFGALYSSLVYKLCATEKDEVIDVADTSDSGKNFTEAFAYEVKNKAAFKNRAKHVVKYMVENQLI
ncbi:hypothetical protein Zmor_001801 [Zophobas morio]|uniref:CHK kinase-like domain-containing protein n=1 Tax=Zophobas morio TaxID=2755281 RepID=A0AA38J5Y3_9CUCU|nr:hypothetical protein Zmor_001801 [Zophobas morio]